MKISIVTPVFNGEKYIVDTINSILTQRGDFELEYIVVDGKSTDNTLEIVDKFKSLVDTGFYNGYHKRLTMTVVSEKDSGMYDALAKGFKLCTGDIIAYQNADDFYYPGAFNSAVKVFTDLPDVKVFVGRATAVTENGYQLWTSSLNFNSDLVLNGVVNSDVSGYYVPQESVFWRRCTLSFVNMGEFRRYKLAGDFYLWHSFAKHTKFFSADVLIAAFRVTKGQLSADTDHYSLEVSEILLTHKKDELFDNKKYPMNLSASSWQEKVDAGMICYSSNDNKYIVNQNLYWGNYMQTIPIFCASDDNYAPFLCTFMYSILECTKSNIEFYVLDGGVENSSKELIYESLEKFENYSIEYIDMSSFDLSRFPDVRHYSLNAFSRYFIPEIKPELDRVIYLDVDIIARGDVVELFNQDLDEYPLGAVLEDFYEGNYTYLKETIYPQYDGGSNYLNSGVLLMDCKKIREENLTDKLVSTTIDLFKKLSCPDQDVYNIVFANNFKILDYRFNFMPDHFDLLQRLHPEKANDIKENIVLIHYTGGKPWTGYSCASCSFWGVANRTKFAKRIKLSLLPDLVNNLQFTDPAFFMKDGPKITVITVTYNLINAGRHETFLRNVESVRKQTYKNIEHIIIDGASNDGTLELIKSTGLTYYSEPDTGIYNAMNKGIEKANGKYITFLNSDDYYYNNIGISHSISLLECNSADYCYSDARITEEDKEVSTFIGTEKYFPFGYFYCHQTQIVKLDVIKELSGFRDNLISADNDLMLRLVANDKKGVFVLTEYVSFDNSGFSTSIDPKENQKEHIKLFYELFGERFNLSAEDCEQLVKFKYVSNENVKARLSSNITIKTWCDAIIEKAAEINGVSISNITKQPEKYFSQQNVITSQDYVKKHYILGIPVVRIAKTPYIKRVSLLGLPILRRSKNDGTTRYKVLGLQVLRVAKNNAEKRISILGLPIVKKTRNEEFKRTYLFGIRIYKKMIKDKFSQIKEHLEVFNYRLNQLDNIQIRLEQLDNIQIRLEQLDNIQIRLEQLDNIQIRLEQLIMRTEQNITYSQSEIHVLKQDITASVNVLNHLMGIITQDNRANQIIEKVDSAIETINFTRYIHLPAMETHKNIFTKYKDIHNGKKIVLVGAGPTLNDFVPIDGAIYIGVNRTFKSDKVKLDYLFIQDNLFDNDDQAKANAYSKDCKKFYGRHYLVPAPSVSDSNIADAKEFYFIDQPVPTKQLAVFSPDITTRPLNTWSSIIFPALEFALWTNPSEIYLVGCDCTTIEHFDNTTSEISIDRVVYGWKQMKKYIHGLYPDTKVFSINPIGLQDIFTDIHYMNGNYKTEMAVSDYVELFKNVKYSNEFLNINRMERMDANRDDIFPIVRANFHLNRYRFASAYINGKIVVDSASGTGYGANLMEKLGCAKNIYGLELDLKAVAYARYNYESSITSFTQGSITDMPFSDNFCDVFTSFETLEHVLDEDKQLKEIKRVLKNDGYYILSTPNSWGITEHHVRDYDYLSVKEAIGKYFTIEAIYNQNSGSDDIILTTDENYNAAECYIVVAKNNKL